MIVSRRNMLAGLAGGAAAVCLDFPASATRIKTIGLQTYTVREIFAKDPVGTLEQIARIGYREVEFGGGGYDGMDPAMLRSTLDRLGLKAPSVHIGYEALLANFAPSVAMARKLGADTVILPYMMPEHRTERAWRAALPNIARIAADLKAAGLGFAYHHHDFEFAIRPGGVSLFDRLIGEIDPALMKIELDLYWATRAGMDVASLVERLSGRIYAFHVKDIRADGGMAAVGAGTIDFAALFRLKGSAGVRHFYVENDQAPAPYLPDISKSFAALRALDF